MGYPGVTTVSNITPLRHLNAIEQDHLLDELFENVFVLADWRIRLSCLNNGGCSLRPDGLRGFSSSICVHLR